MFLDLYLIGCMIAFGMAINSKETWTVKYKFICIAALTIGSWVIVGAMMREEILK